MAIEVTTYIVCDECQCCNRDTFISGNHAAGGKVRESLREQGWATRYRGGYKVDLCPPCANSTAEAPST